MKSKKFLAFAALVVVVVGYALYDYRSNQTAEKAKAVQSLLLNTPKDQIKSFAIRTPETEIELQKDVDGWKMMKPVQDAGDSAAADAFVEGLATEKSTDIAVEGDSVDLSNFGLKAPKGTITVVSNLGQKTEFKVGSMKNFQGDSFLQKDDEKKVYIASSTWFSKVDKKATDFRDRRLMRLSNAKAERITLEKDKSKIDLVKKENGWILSNHPDWKLDQNRVRELLSMLNTTEALEFIVEGPAKPEEMKKWGLVKPAMNLQVGLKDGVSWSAQFASGSDKVHRVHVSQPDMVLKISPTDSDKFFQMTENYFRDRSEPFDFDRSKVQSLEIKLGKQSGSFKPTDEKVRTLLNQLSSLKVADFEESKKTASLSDQIVLKSEKGDILSLQWGDLHSVKGASDKVYSAKSSLYPHGFTIQESDIANLKLDEFLKKESVK